MRRSLGFTLIEVLVALAVVAVALTTGLQATGALTRQAQRQTDQWLAELCADNELTRLRLARQLPAVGDTVVNCAQAGRNLQVRLGVSPPPNPNFRRVDAVVEGTVDGQLVRLLSISTVQGRF